MIHLLMLEKNMVLKNILFGIITGIVQKISLIMLKEEIVKLKMKKIYGINIGQGINLCQKKIPLLDPSCLRKINKIILMKWQ